MIEEGVRNGITQVSHGYGKANNKYMKNYDKNEESSFVMYLDANNLFGCPVTEKLPVGNFKWVKNASKIGEALEHGLKLKQVHQAFGLYQEALLKPYIEMNTELRKNAKNDFEKDFYKLMNNAVFGKTMENVRKHRDIKPVTNNKKRCKLASKPNYHTTKWFSKIF